MSRELTKSGSQFAAIEVMGTWCYLYPKVEEIHVWGGFTCVGLSSVRAGRRL
jgi:hypothetical protein